MGGPTLIAIDYCVFVLWNSTWVSYRLNISCVKHCHVALSRTAAQLYWTVIRYWSRLEALLRKVLQEQRWQMRPWCPSFLHIENCFTHIFTCKFSRSLSEERKSFLAFNFHNFFLRSRMCMAMVMYMVVLGQVKSWKNIKILTVPCPLFKNSSMYWILSVIDPAWLLYNTEGGWIKDI